MRVEIATLTIGGKDTGWPGTDRLKFFFQIDEFAAVEPQGFEK